MSELLPCPFCGGEPKQRESDWFSYKCSNCGMTNNDTHAHQRAAIAAWNTRANVSAAGGAEPVSRSYPCGCVLCICDDDLRCHGCGAKSCGKSDADCDYKQERIRAIRAHPSVAGMPDEPTGLVEEKIREIAMRKIKHYYQYSGTSEIVNDCESAIREAVRALGGA